MLDLAKHIEILLLENDCVILPGFGGLVAHRVPARYVAEEHLFLPPYRTLGFNPALKMNDGLLVQSYMMDCDASFPEATQILQDIISELKQCLHTEGHLELHGIGVLRENIKGEYAFEPKESGILTPALYGTSSFELTPVSELEEQERSARRQEAEAQQQATAKIVHLEPSFVQETETRAEAMNHSGHRERYINIAAAVIAIVLVSALVIPFTRFDTPSSAKKQVMSETLTKDSRSLVTKMVDFMTNSSTKKVETKTVKTSRKAVKTAVKPTVQPAVQPAAQPAAEKPVVEKPADTSYYTLVLASQVTRKNAEGFMAILTKKNFTKATLLEGKFLRVVYDRFATEAEAYQVLHDLRSQDAAFQQAWIMKVN